MAKPPRFTSYFSTIRSSIEGEPESAPSADIRSQLSTSSQSSQPLDIRSQLPENFTPGHVLSVLNQSGKGGAEILHSDFRFLLECARPDEKKDAGVILTAMRNYKRINNFLLDLPLAKDCIDQIMLSDPEYGALLVIENFTKQSGLYFSAPLYSIHTVMEKLLQVVENESQLDLKNRSQEALPGFVQELIMRKNRPYRKMKKRARRKYLQQIKIHQGPNGKTVELLMELGLVVSNNDVEWVNDELIQPCLDNRVNVHDGVLHEWNSKRLLSEKTSDENEENEVE